jgi:hypothetical protein
VQQILLSVVAHRTINPHIVQEVTKLPLAASYTRASNRVYDRQRCNDTGLTIRYTASLRWKTFSWMVLNTSEYTVLARLRAAGVPFAKLCQSSFSYEPHSRASAD